MTSYNGVGKSSQLSPAFRVVSVMGLPGYADAVADAAYAFYSPYLYSPTLLLYSPPRILASSFDASLSTLSLHQVSGRSGLAGYTYTCQLACHQVAIL